MKRYIAFLRGVNISGRNKVTMTELKKGIERLGYEEVKTYLNSGNVIFSSDENDIGSITKQIVMTIKSQFDLDIPVFVIAKEELEDILQNAPDWWGNDDKEIYDNLIFIMPPVKFIDVFNEIGEPKEELEKIEEAKERREELEALTDPEHAEKERRRDGESDVAFGDALTEGMLLMQGAKSNIEQEVSDMMLKMKLVTIEAKGIKIDDGFAPSPIYVCIYVPLVSNYFF